MTYIYIYTLYLTISFLHLCVCISTLQRPSTHWRGRPVDVAGLCVALRSISARTQQLDVKTTTKSKVSEGLKHARLKWMLSLMSSSS